MYYYVMYHDSKVFGSVQEMINLQVKVRKWKLVSVAPVLVTPDGVITSFLVTWQVEVATWSLPDQAL